MSLPQIVDEQQWRESNAALIEKEKAATRAGDALAAERRRQPMMAFDTGFEFDGPVRPRLVPGPVRGPAAAGALPLLVPGGRRAVRRLHDVHRPGDRTSPTCTRAT